MTSNVAGEQQSHCSYITNFQRTLMQVQQVCPELYYTRAESTSSRLNANWSALKWPSKRVSYSLTETGGSVVTALQFFWRCSNISFKHIRTLVFRDGRSIFDHVTRSKGIYGGSDVKSCSEIARLLWSKTTDNDSQIDEPVRNWEEPSNQPQY